MKEDNLPTLMSEGGMSEADGRTPGACGSSEEQSGGAHAAPASAEVVGKGRSPPSCNTILATIAAVTWVSLASYSYTKSCTQECWSFIGWLTLYTLVLTLVYPLLMMLALIVVGCVTKKGRVKTRQHTRKFLAAAFVMCMGVSHSSYAYYFLAEVNFSLGVLIVSNATLMSPGPIPPTPPTPPPPSWTPYGRHLSHDGGDNGRDNGADNGADNGSDDGKHGGGGDDPRDDGSPDGSPTDGGDTEHGDSPSDKYCRLQRFLRKHDDDDESSSKACVIQPVGGTRPGISPSGNMRRRSGGDIAVLVLVDFLVAVLVLLLSTVLTAPSERKLLELGGGGAAAAPDEGLSYRVLLLESLIPSLDSTVGYTFNIFCTDLIFEPLMQSTSAGSASSGITLLRSRGPSSSPWSPASATCRFTRGGSAR